MTLTEATQQGIARLRRPMWAHENAYLKLQIRNGLRGPWAELWSRDEQQLIEAPTPQRIMMIGDQTDDYVEYLGSIDEEDR